MRSGQANTAAEGEKSAPAPKVKAEKPSKSEEKEEKVEEPRESANVVDVPPDDIPF
jgi:hypothetical protein